MASISDKLGVLSAAQKDAVRDEIRNIFEMNFSQMKTYSRVWDLAAHKGRWIITLQFERDELRMCINIKYKDN